MSGASISLGVSLSETRWDAVYQAGLLIVVFVAAATASTAVSVRLRRWSLLVVLLLEAICLSGSAIMGGVGWRVSVAIFPIIAAMGIQNTALSPVGGVRLGVTFMTGTLVSFGRELGRWLIGRVPWWRCLPHGLVWCAFVAGAGAGTALHIRYGFVAIVVPAITAWVLAALAALAVKRTENPDIRRL